MRDVEESFKINNHTYSSVIYIFIQTTSPNHISSLSWINLSLIYFPPSAVGEWGIQGEPLYISKYTSDLFTFYFSLCSERVWLYKVGEHHFTVRATAASSLLLQTSPWQVVGSISCASSSSHRPAMTSSLSSSTFYTVCTPRELFFLLLWWLLLLWYGCPCVFYLFIQMDVWSWAPWFCLYKLPLERSAAG